MGNTPSTIFLVMGARPNFMKVAPLVRVFTKSRLLQRQFRLQLVHTGQHTDPAMAENVLRDLGIPPVDHHLGAVGGGTHAEQTAKILVSFEALCLRERPEWVWVVGDVTSTLACALVAKKLQIQLAHIESGLRSFNRSMPEEINRLAVDAISDLLFTTSEDATRQLKKEGIARNQICTVGNLMIDTLFYQIKAMKLKISKQPRDFHSSHCLITAHRPQNVDGRESLQRLVDIIQQVSRRIRVVFPCHPRTRQALEKFGLVDALSGRNIQVEPPADYNRMLRLYADAALVMTDSGGVQEETTALGIPCLTLRDETERPITVTSGTSILVGLDRELILRLVGKIEAGKFKKGKLPKLWDGRAAERTWSMFCKASQPKRKLGDVA